MDNLGVYKAINSVQKALSKEGISKDHKNQAQGYSFRGIDDVYNALSPLLAEHGLCILPRIISRECTERQTTKGGAIFYVTVEAEFDFVSSSDGSRHTVRMFGEAMDSGDKATNKAMSSAYKYAAFQAFSIPTEGDNDADLKTHEVQSKRITPLDGAMEALSPPMQDLIKTLARDIFDYVDNGSPESAIRIFKEAYINDDDGTEDIDIKNATWSLLDSKTQRALKKYKQENK